MKTKVSVIGSGSWGTALAQIISSRGQEVTLWARRNEIANAINEQHQNPSSLLGIELSKEINAVSNIQQACQAEIILMVTPAQTLRNMLETMKPFLKNNTIFVLCAKGIELNTGFLMSEIASQYAPLSHTAILSGPNFAREIALGHPAATTIACQNQNIAEKLQHTISSRVFRPYITDDIIGVQIAGALKNVIALACGMAHGLELGESTRASITTRGMAEIVRLGLAMGAKTETFLGLSGMGDLMLTCSSLQSRNFSTGVALGQKKQLKNINSEGKTLSEGVHTAKAALKLAEKYQIEMPICTSVHRFLNEGRNLDDTIKDMLNRPLRTE